jgi:SAM-dependent methyltransferase
MEKDCLTSFAVLSKLVISNPEVKDLEFTGERYLPSEQGEIRIEHYHRYALALSLAKNMTVLDVACGEGYGSALLSEVAFDVIGVDISPEAVAHASKTYQGRANLRFLQKSAFKTDLPDASFDLVVSFETVEHLLEQDAMLAELRRVLKPEGLLLISSPNRPVYSEGRAFTNEFHVKELDFDEFDQLLRRYFAGIEYYGQRLAMGTVVQPLQGHCAVFKAFSDDGKVVSEHTGKLSDPVYFLALCSASEAEMPNLGASAFFPDSVDLVKHYTGFAKWAQNQDIEIELRDKNVRHYKSEVAQLERQRELLRTEILRAEAQLELLKDILLDQLGDAKL